MNVLLFRALPTAPITFSGTPVWAPLERLVGAAARDFMYMGQAGRIHLYKHSDTRRYLNIHQETGMCYRHTPGGYLPIERQQALREVFPRRAENEEEW